MVVTIKAGRKIDRQQSQKARETVSVSDPSTKKSVCVCMCVCMNVCVCVCMQVCPTGILFVRNADHMIRNKAIR